MLQMSVNSGLGAGQGSAITRTLAQLREGESGVLDRLDLPEDISRRLMELGFLPGHIIIPARSAPGGEPRVYRVDGSEVALRRETASHLILRPSNGDKKELQARKARRSLPSYERLPRVRRMCGCGSPSFDTERRAQHTSSRLLGLRTRASPRSSIASLACAKKWQTFRE